GLLDDRECTLEEVAQQIGVTRERIRQVETKILRKLLSSPVAEYKLQHDWLKDGPPVNITDTTVNRRKRREAKEAVSPVPDANLETVTEDSSAGSMIMETADAIWSSADSAKQLLPAKPSTVQEIIDPYSSNQPCDDVIAW